MNATNGLIVKARELEEGLRKGSSLREESQRLSEPQAARILQVSDRTLRRWRAAGRVTFYQSPGGRISYDLGDLVAFRQSMRVRAIDSGHGCSHITASVHICPATGIPLPGNNGAWQIYSSME